MAIVNNSGMAYMHDVTEPWFDDSTDGVVTTTRSVYELRIGGRRVLLASVVNADSKLRIQLGRPDAESTGKWHVTEASAVRGVHLVPASDGGDIPDGLIEHIDGVSVQAYVISMLPFILTRMYNIGEVVE